LLCARSALGLSGERELVGRVAVVTGATSGLGRATALAFAQAGADVALLARHEGDLADVAAEAARFGVRAVPLPVDLAEGEQVVRAAERALDEVGGVDVLVNSAATDAPGGVRDITASDWDRVLAVNLRAPFLLCQAVLPSMRKTGGGTIVNVSSVAGKRGWANASAYCASKFALAGLTQALAAEGKADGIRVCVVFPGGMATGWGAWSRTKRQLPREPSPAERSLPPEDIAALIVWIAAAPKELVLNEVIATPLEEQGWP
jgi:NAD(P)-dependent dehydrogenase (short-subunit alcohol dehydrogenase family)